MLQQNTISGRAEAYIQALPYQYDFDLKIGEDGTLTGTYKDIYEGVPFEGPVTGVCRPQAKKNGHFSLSWHRLWCGSNASPWDFQFFVDLKDGTFGNEVFQAARSRGIRHHDPQERDDL